MADAFGSSKIQMAFSRRAHAGNSAGVILASSMAKRIAEAFPCGYLSLLPAADTTACFARSITGNVREMLGGFFISTPMAHASISLISSRFGYSDPTSRKFNGG